MQKTRECSKCHKVLPATLEYFRKNSSSNTGGDKYLRPECIDCTTKAEKGRKAAKKLAGNPKSPKLGTPCHNCGRTDQKLLFDHDHETLEHRGWLCSSCNRSFGMLGDTIGGLERAILYLKGKGAYGSVICG